MSNSSLVNYTKLSPHCESRAGQKITDITVHHMAGNLSVIECGNVFQNREASANYGIDGQGRVGLYVDESKASWANGNLKSNQRSITIELANDEIGGKWHVSDTALEKCVQLCADICVRNGIKKLNYTGDTTGNLTAHRFFMSTSCPGPYLFGRFQYIADEVNKRIKGGWVRDGAEWHFYKDGLILKNAWAEDKVGWTWLGSDGNIVKNSWLKEKGVWYYLGADGYMAKNKWQKDKTGQWCYLGSDGKQALDKWLIYKSNIYYIKPDGYMATGRLSLECEFDDSGKLKR